MPSAAKSEIELSARRRIELPPSRVWLGLTSKRDIESWWSSDDVRTTVRRLEVRPGGAIEFHLRYVPAMMTPDASSAFQAAGVPISFSMRGRFGEVAPERVIEFDLNLSLDARGQGVGMMTRFELDSAGGVTNLRVVASGEDTPHWRSLGQRNLEAQLERLECRLRATEAAR